MKELNDKAILVVDDDAGMLRALRKVLAGAGALVTSSETAEEAIEILTARRARVDLVITDLRMPHVSGMTFLYAVHEIFPRLPIMVLTAFGSPVVKDECLRQGAVAVLEKPLNTPQLLEAIERAFAAQKTAPAA